MSSQDLEISGDKENLEKFKEFAKSGKCILCTDKFIPYPENYRELDKKARAWLKKADAFARENGCVCWWCGDKLDAISRRQYLEANGEQPADGYNQGGYEWCIAHWNSKWGISNSFLESESDTFLFYSFETAYNPAYTVVEKMSEMFPTLHFELKYYEAGMGFKGTYVVEGGRVLVDVHEDYKCECEEVECKCNMRGG